VIELYDRLQRLFDLVAGAEPAELRDSYLAHPAGDRPQAPGTTVPMVGQRFVRADSGLLVPPGAAAHGFTDTMRTYLTGREVFGVAIPPSEVLRALQANAAEDFLVAAAYHLTQVEATSVLDTAVQLQAADDLFRGDPLDRVRRAIGDGSVLLAPQVLLAVMKAAALVSPPGPVTWPAPGGPDFVTVLLGLAGLLTTENAGAERWGGLPAALSLELAQNQHFNRVMHLPALLGRYQRIWRELPTELDEVDPDVAALFEELTGVAADDLLLVGFMLWTSSYVEQRPGVPAATLATLPLPPARVERALDLLVTDLDTLATELVQEAEILQFPWAYATLRRRPVLRLTDGSLLVLSLRFLIERVCGGALYWEVHDRLKAQDNNAAQGFRILHGRLVERYVEEVVLSLAPELAGGARRVWFEEDQQRAWGRSVQVCDVAIDYGAAWACVEIIARRPTQVAAAGSSITSWDDELARFVTERKARQLASTIGRLRMDESALTGRPAAPGRRFFPVVLAAYGFPVNPATLAVVHERVATAGLLQEPDIAPLEVIELDELEHVEGLHDHGGPSLVELLGGKEHAQLRLAGLDHYMYFERRLPLQAPTRIRRLVDVITETIMARFPS
jgi:hypothetical protein